MIIFNISRKLNLNLFRGRSKNGFLIVKFLALVSPRPRYSVINEHVFNIFRVMASVMFFDTYRS